MPGEVRGTQIPLAVRLMHVAQDADVAWQYGGTAPARSIPARRAGAGLAPQAVRTFLSLGDQPHKGPDAPSLWEGAQAAQPAPHPALGQPRRDRRLWARAEL